MNSSSSALSKEAESLPPGWMIAQGVDFAVVRDIAVGMGELPSGEGVGGETLVHQAERAHQLRIAQLGIKMGHLRRQQQAFVDDGAGRKRRNVERGFLRQVGRGDLRFGALAHHEQFALQPVFGHALGAPHEDLLNIRLRTASHAADGRAVDGRIAPAQHGKALLADDALQDAFALQARMRLYRKEGHAHAVFPGRGQREAQPGALAREEPVRNLDEDAGAVAGFRVAAAGSAVRQIDQKLDSLDDDVVRLLTLDVGDEADAAGVALAGGVVKTLRRG
jgi:hypothetical protein